MLGLHVFLLLFALLGRTVVSSEKNENCEALVIQQCSDRSQGLLKAVESGNQRFSDKDCGGLQVSH